MKRYVVETRPIFLKINYLSQFNYTTWKIPEGCPYVCFLNDQGHSKRFPNLDFYFYSYFTYLHVTCICVYSQEDIHIYKSISYCECFFIVNALYFERSRTIKAFSKFGLLLCLKFYLFSCHLHMCIFTRWHTYIKVYILLWMLFLLLLLEKFYGKLFTFLITFL